MANIRPKFRDFRLTLGEICNEARQKVWKLDKTVEFIISGKVYKYKSSSNIVASDAIDSQTAPNNNASYIVHENTCNQSKNRELLRLSNFITKSDNLLNGETIDEGFESHYQN
jgi:hypothetical protein